MKLYLSLLLSLFLKLVVASFSISGDVRTGELTASGEIIQLVEDNILFGTKLGVTYDRGTIIRYLTGLNGHLQCLFATYRPGTYRYGDYTWPVTLFSWPVPDSTWEPARLKLKALSARVVSTDFTPSVLFTDTWDRLGTSSETENHAEQPEHFTKTVEHSWFNADSISISQSVDVKLGGLGSSSSFEYSHEWGSSDTMEEVSTITTLTGATSVTPPGQCVDIQIWARRGKVTIEVTYEASLEGEIIGYFGAKKGKPVYSRFFNITDALAFGGVTTPFKQIVKEQIKIGYVQQVNINITDCINPSCPTPVEERLLRGSRLFIEPVIESPTGK